MLGVSMFGQVSLEKHLPRVTQRKPLCKMIFNALTELFWVLDDIMLFIIIYSRVNLGTTKTGHGPNCN